MENPNPARWTAYRPRATMPGPPHKPGTALTKLDWDYTRLAKAYVDRPDYSAAAIDAVLAIAKPGKARVADLGAGAGHLTKELAARGLTILAMEPNPNMRAEGMASLGPGQGVTWADGVMQDTGLPAGDFALVTYGSSFGVVDRGEALTEAARLLRPGGWMMSLFNHRDLDDPLQKKIEAHIHTAVPGYGYGTRREDQTPAIDASGLFGPVHRMECPVLHRVPAGAWVNAWRSHATLERQAGDAFDNIVAAIAGIVAAEGNDTLDVPYVTRVWMAQRRP